MFSLPNFSIKRPVTVLIAVVSLIAFGITSIFAMPLESTPSISMPMLMVITNYPNASPDEIDEMVSQPIESSLMTIADVVNISSTSSDGMSMVMLEFDFETDIDKRTNDVTAAISMLRLPDGAFDPLIFAMDASLMNSSIMSLSIETSGDARMISYIEENLVTGIERIPGVADVAIVGADSNYVSITLDENKLSQYGLTMQSVASAIATAEYERTVGGLDRGDTSLSIVGSKEYSNYYELGDIPITLKTGDIIYVSDVSAIDMKAEEVTSFSRTDGVSTVGISVTKEQTGNTVAITEQIATLVDEINNSGAGLHISVTSDSGELIMDNIMSVFDALVTGLAIAVFVLFFFFGEWKSSFIVGLSMPLSVFAALVLMSFFDMTINLMSLGGLVVGIGMMVDSAIVVLDSCFAAIDNRISFTDAVAKGANMVTGSIVASTATTVVVFLPIALMDGMSGQLFWDVCMTIVFSLVASLLSALTLVPLLFVRLKPRERTNGFAAKMMNGLRDGYTKVLKFALNKRKSVIIISIATLILSLFLFTQLEMELMPADATGQVTFTAETKLGLDLEHANDIVTQLEAIVAEDERVESYRISVGGTSMFGGASSPTVTATLKEEYLPEINEFTVDIEEKALAIDNVKISSSQADNMMGMMGGSGNVSLQLQGMSLETLEDYSQEIIAQAEQTGLYKEVYNDLSDGAPRAKIEVDPILAGSVGMTPSTVLTAVTQRLMGSTAMTLIQDGAEYDVIVEYEAEKYTDMDDLFDMMIDTPTGMQVALSDLAEISYESSPSTISRNDGEYVVTVTAIPHDPNANVATLSTELMNMVNSSELPADISLYEGDDMAQMYEEFTAILTAMAIAVYLVFAVMAVQFESLRFSFVVMISVPFSVTGAFMGLYLTGNSISVTSLLGLVMLAGIVVNNAIVLIDHAQMVKADGLSTFDALVEAGRARIRPILMSSLTTIVGLVPMAMGIGGAVSMMQGLAYTVIGGLTVSTVLTLVLIPTFYMMFDPDARRERKQAKRQKRADKKAARAAK